MRGRRFKLSVADQVRAHRGLVVLIAANYGYEPAFWLLNFSPLRLEDWWLNRKSFWHAYGPEDDVIADILGVPRKKYRRPMRLPGRGLSPETKVDFTLWDRLVDGHRHYICNVCCDSESWLVTPDRRHLHHKGYTGEPLGEGFYRSRFFQLLELEKVVLNKTSLRSPWEPPGHHGRI